MHAKIIFLFMLAMIGLELKLHSADFKPITTKLALESKEETFSDLVRDLIALGEKADHTNEPFRGKLAALLGFESGAYGRGGGVDMDLTTDFLNHKLEVILDRTSNKDAPNVIAVIFETDIVIERVGNEAFHFRISPSGKLEKVVRIAGPYDGANKPIPGAGKASVLDINDSEVQYRFQHEMDFWLKNMYRRKKPALRSEAPK